MATILVVDDEKEICEALQAFLISRGYRVNSAVSSEAALTVMQAETPDLVLLDIKMPGMNGMELLQKIKEIDDEVSVIMVTGLFDLDTAVSAMKNGAYDYITKPVDLNKLGADVKGALAKRELIRADKESRKVLKSAVRKMSANLESALFRLKNAQEKIKWAHHDTIFRLSLAAEFKDKLTASHLKKIGEYSAITARAYGLKEEDVQSIRLASIMHDIGKIGIPDSILLKPSSLTTVEYNQIKKHPFIGKEILAGADDELLNIAGTISMTHHERYDGNGYPYGLMGEDIPIWGRIVAVADVFDALTSYRVYKEAIPVEEADIILIENSGKHFDPRVLEAFFSEKNAVHKVMADYSNGDSLKQVFNDFKNSDFL